MTEEYSGDVAAAYLEQRRPDPRIAAAILEALADARTVVNLGAGTGSYEPTDRFVVAVEPSSEMIGRRPPSSGPAVRAVAEALPFGDDSFDAALAVLSLHHFSDQDRGLGEMRRVARERVVLLTCDREFDLWSRFWLTAEFFPGIADLDRGRFLPLERIGEALGSGLDVRPVPIPHDCVDGFGCAYWRRPGAYLDPRVRRAMSWFALIDPREVEEGCRRLEEDLLSGAWQERHGELRALDELDLGYRLVIAGLRP